MHATSHLQTSSCWVANIGLGLEYIGGVHRDISIGAGRIRIKKRDFDLAHANLIKACAAGVQVGKSVAERT